MKETLEFVLQDGTHFFGALMLIMFIGWALGSALHGDR